ncbi:MAG TPA: RNA polymerase sigma factor [Candidatus Saccharimonadia bacterium]|nr:RNA polymerase sigma factor [Candidatus Saccharimonadia bacterium]
MKLDSPEDFKKAYEEYSEAIHRFLYWQTKDAILAQDLTSTVFERAWKSRKRFKDGSVQAWLYRISRNLLTDHWRKKKDLYIDDVPGLAERIADPTAPYDYDAELKLWQLGRSLEILSEELRAVVILRFIDGMSARQTGEILGLSEGNVRVMQFRALRRLRKVLENGHQ